MTAYTPVVHNTTVNTHEPLAAGDTLALPANTVPVAAVAGLTAAAVPVSPAVAGATDVQAALTALALLAATDVKVSAISFNALTGVMTVTNSDATSFTATITDVELVTGTAPATTVNPAIPTTYYGTNTARLGNPDGWFLVNGKKVGFYN